MYESTNLNNLYVNKLIFILYTTAVPIRSIADYNMENSNS